MRGFADEAVHEYHSLLKPDVDEVARRTSFRLSHVLFGVLWPTLLFIAVFGVVQTRLRHSHVLLTSFFIEFIPFAINSAITYLAWKHIRRRSPSSRWIIILAVCMWGAEFGALLSGDTTYWRYMNSYFNFEDLAAYIDVDPSKDKGQSYMDAGQIYFKEGSQVATQRAIAYRSSEIYCVAPIMRGEDPGSSASGGIEENVGSKDSALKLPPSGTIDFWAVGINCCDPSGLDPGPINFKCSEATSPYARAGIRQLRDDTRPFFKMAVEAWSAALNMPVKHPLFFHWVADPLDRIDQYYTDAMDNFKYEVLRCIMITSIVTIVLHFILFEMGF
mmetsp:Transcript_48372/g.85161  ORF Transcript_48372/g.85161 Transcript_48372/m.85161 type:complete len:331 (-) Transcript_48372:107-1099(-)